MKLALAAILTGNLAIAVTAAEPQYASQGDNWTTVARADFYTRDQGSQLIPYDWFKALKQPNGEAFLADQLGRYGYLPNPGNPSGLPVGFTKASIYAGMNCSACHTRQISVNGEEWRIDGGPAIVDAQSLFVDLDKAVADVLKSDANFLEFAKAVLGPPNGPPNPDPSDVEQLKEEVAAWFLRFDVLIQNGLPVQSWGPGRMDAVGMIFNRLTGLDLGQPPSHIIADNIRPADAPVRYPFLWNATKQDKTQWPGFADNGSDLLGLARNLGEVYGVFANFFPEKDGWRLLGADFLAHNSANFDGLGQLEDLVKKIGPPKYPWKIDRALAAKGKKIYELPTAQGGCADCHGIKPGKTRFFQNKTWATPLVDVGTDTREYSILDWTAQTGVLEGTGFPFKKLKATDTAFNILSLSVVGSILQEKTTLLNSDVRNFSDKSLGDVEAVAEQALADVRDDFKLPTVLQDLEGAFTHPSDRPAPANALKLPQTLAATTKYVYESRVLQGIWATAPYLHNGSVPTLAYLLEPADKRPKKFKIGPNYDIESVGLAKEQTKFGNQTVVIDPERNSGNSNQGHEFGTDLKPEEKKALLEYLKAL